MQGQSATGAPGRPRDAGTSDGEAPSGERYRIDALLGRGGVGSVYRAYDTARGQVVALKRLELPNATAEVAIDVPAATTQANPHSAGEPRGRARHRTRLISLFQREYHSLAQLAHPRIIEVYDYGLDRDGPYYTMELLEGQDLSKAAAMPWQRVCEVLRDVASALTLLHARRLLHRDISPRNVHCSAHGPAKLIDFGAMTPMGMTDLLVGTPSFVAPEVVQRQALDARSDLYSLGALGYFLLTRKPPYPARDFAELRDAYRSQLAPPSAYAPDVPRALDTLVLQLLSLDRAARPSSAVELVERLTALSGLAHDPRLAVPSAYLTTPALVGRQRELLAVRRRTLRALRGHGASLVVSGAAGVGRSRFIDACALEGKISGAIVLRAAPGAARSDHSAMRALLLQLHASLGEADRRRYEPPAALLRQLLPGLIWARARSKPTSLPPTARADDRGTLAQALHDYVARIAATRSVMIVIDDFHGLDEASAAVIATLASLARSCRLVLVVAHTEGAPVTAASALRMLLDCSRPLPLAPLGAHESEALLHSVFGAVPNLALVADRLHEWSDGKPLLCIQLAQHLVDCGVIRYEAGGFVLPEALAARDLPESLEAAMRARVARLPASARQLGAVVALCADLPVTVEECFALLEHDDRGDAERALSELVAAQLAIVEDDRIRLRQGAFANVFGAELDPERLRRVHGAIADLLIVHSDLPVIAAEHYFLAERVDAGIDALLDVGQRRLTYEFRSTFRELIARAIQDCARLGRPARDAFLLRRSRLHHLMHYLQPCDREELLGFVHEVYRMAGFGHWEALEGQLEGEARVARALELAVCSHDQTPERERIFHPVAAIEELANLLAAAAGYGVGSFDTELLERLPSMAPYAVLSPAIELMENVSRALRDLRANRHERYVAAMQAILARLEQPDRAGLPVDTYPVIRLSIMYAVALTYGALGNPRALEYADQIEALPSMRSSAWRVRLIANLHLGDAHQAEQCRRQLELSLIQHGSRQAHGGTTLETEFMCYAAADDLLNLRRLMPEFEAMARKHAGWEPVWLLAQGELERLRGRLQAARELYERALELARPGKHYFWPYAMAFQIQVLVDLGHAREAKELGLRAFEFCQQHEMSIYGYYLAGPLANAEAALGEHDRAIARADGLITEIERLGVCGYFAGSVYEVRARLAVLASDAAGFAHNVERCRAHYGCTRDSPFAARLGRLLAEARSAQLAVDASMEPSSHAAVQRLRRELAACGDLEERADRALSLVIETTGAQAGHLYGLRGERLVRLASLHAEPPGAELTRALEAFIATVNAADEQSTAIVDLTSTVSTAQAAMLCEAGGLSYEPFSLAGPGETAVAAVALSFAAGQRRAPAGELLGAVAEELVVRGDVTVIATFR